MYDSHVILLLFVLFHCQKLSKKYSQNPEFYVTLQAIVLHELQTNTHNEKNSATDALLWLKR